MGTVNSFAGVDLSDLTGGVYNSQSLTQGNNALCFAYTSLLTLTPDILKGVLKDVTGAVNQIVGQFIKPQFASLNCPSVQCEFSNAFALGRKVESDPFVPYPQTTTKTCSQSILELPAHIKSTHCSTQYVGFDLGWKRQEESERTDGH